jgi:hypothetical protein
VTPLNSTSFLANSSEVYVVENPFKSRILLNTVHSKDDFALYSISGKELYIVKEIGAKNFCYLSKGVYFVKIVNQYEVFKIIKL